MQEFTFLHFVIEKQICIINYTHLYIYQTPWTDSCMHPSGPANWPGGTNHKTTNSLINDPVTSHTEDREQTRAQGTCSHTDKQTNAHAHT